MEQPPPSPAPVLDYPPHDRQALYGPNQTALRSILEIAFVFGALVMCVVVLTVTPLGEWIALMTTGSSVYGQVALHGFLALALVAVVSLVSGSSLRDLGLVRDGFGMNVGIGFLAVVPAYCLTAASSLILALIVGYFSGRSLESMATEKMPMLEMVSTISPVVVVPLTLFIGLYEEVLFRGFLMGRLQAVTGRVGFAVAIGAVLFGLFHVPSQGWIGFVQTSFLGLILSLLAVWRKSLWPAVACHAGIDMVGMFLVLLLDWFLKVSGQEGFSSGVPK